MGETHVLLLRGYRGRFPPHGASREFLRVYLWPGNATFTSQGSL
jgi:hypothetical protein